MSFPWAGPFAFVLACAASGAAWPAQALAQATKLADDRCRYEQNGRTWQVTIPNKDQPVRGLFVNGNPGTGDLLGWTTNPFFRPFAARFGFGLVASKGVEGSSTYGTYAAVILKAIEDCGKALGHPELAWAPLVPLGNSSGATNAWGLTMYRPARVLAFAVNIPGTNFTPGAPVEAALKIPGIVVLGQNDRGNLASPNGAMLREARSKGSLWSTIEMEGIGHENRRSWHLFHAFFEKVIALRLPANADPLAGPVELRPVNEEQGFIADDSTWSSGLTKYASHAAFTGNKRGPNTSWLLDEDMAFLHQAYSSRGRPFDLTTMDLPPGTDTGTILPLEMNTNVVNRMLGTTVELLGTAKDPGWTKMELYVGAKKLDEVTGGGATFKFTVRVDADPPAVWPFSVRGTLPGGVRPSQMLSVLVRPGQPMPGTGGAGGAPSGTAGAGGGGGAPSGSAGMGGMAAAGMGGASSGPSPSKGGAGGSAGSEDSSDDDGDEDDDDAADGTSTGSGCAFLPRRSSPLPWAVVAALGVLIVRRRRR